MARVFNILKGKLHQMELGYKSRFVYYESYNPQQNFVKIISQLTD